MLRGACGRLGLLGRGMIFPGSDHPWGCTTYTAAEGKSVIGGACMCRIRPVYMTLSPSYRCWFRQISLPVSFCQGGTIEMSSSRAVVHLICYLSAFACAASRPARQIFGQHIQTIQRQTADRFDRNKDVDRSGGAQSSTDAEGFTFQDSAASGE